MKKTLATLLAFLLSAQALTQENMGLTLASRGDVRVARDGSERPLKQGDFIAVGDRIILAERSFSVIQLYDGAKLSLRPDTTITVVEFNVDGAAAGNALLELEKGGVKLIAGSITTSNPGGFRIRTPLSELTVKEHEASVALCEDIVCEKGGVE